MSLNACFVSTTTWIDFSNKIIEQFVQWLSVTQSNSDCKLWETRLGHPNAYFLMQILKQLNIHGSSKNDAELCTTCQYGKIHQSHFPKLDSKDSQPLELVYSNIWSSSPFISSEGYKYYIHFIDAYRRFTWIFLLKTKSEAYQTFRIFHKLVER